MGLVCAMVPAGLLWAVFPAPYLSVPGPVWLVVIPAVEVAVACAAINTALTLGVEVIVFAARAWHRVPSPKATGGRDGCAASNGADLGRTGAPELL